jgi:hypothetical protein
MLCPMLPSPSLLPPSSSLSPHSRSGALALLCSSSPYPPSPLLSCLPSCLFHSCDVLGRGVLCNGALALLSTLRARQLPPGPAMAHLLDLLACLTREHAELAKVSNCRNETPF